MTLVVKLGKHAYEQLEARSTIRGTYDDVLHELRRDHNKANVYQGSKENEMRLHFDTVPGSFAAVMEGDSAFATTFMGNGNIQAAKVGATYVGWAPAGRANFRIPEIDPRLAALRSGKKINIGNGMGA